MRKKELRKIYLAKQKALREASRREKSFHLSDSFFENFDLDDIRHFHIFLSIAEKNEIRTSIIINELWGDWVNIKTIVPRVNFDKDVLEHLEFDSESKLKVSEWGIAEPIGADFVDEQKLDIILVPMLCFDKKGFRVGYGKGFYDKFLVKCRADCLKIGLSYFEPVDEIEDVREFDIKLDFVITPEKLWKF